MALALAACLAGGLVLVSPPVGASGPFVDDDESVHQQDIDFIAAGGITKGCNPPRGDRFCPGRLLSRGEMAAFLVRALDLARATGDAFGDDEDSAFEGDIDALAAAGITRGCNPPANDRYCADGTVSRGQMAAFLTRALGLDAGPDFFNDDGGSGFEGDINAIARVGITRGCDPPSNNRYCPEDPVTRAQMATYLRRVVEIRTTGTTSTTTPSWLKDAVPIEPRQRIQSVVDVHPEGSVFLLRAGVHRGQTVAPRDGDRFVGEPGAVLDGEGDTPYAFGGPGDNVTIEGLTIQNYAGEFSQGTVRSVGAALAWTVRNNVIQYNEGAGVQVNPRWNILDNHIHHNSQIGIIGGGPGIVIEGNEIDHNNPERQVSPYVAAGGAKLFNTTDLVVRDNHAHHNGGPGLWTDGDNLDVLYEGNLVEGNAHAGIKHEVSCRATIRDNTAIDNGFENDGWIAGAGILVLNSSNVSVVNNTVRDNNDGIGGIQAARSETSGKNCEWQLVGFVVEGNVIEMGDGHTGIVTDPHRQDVFVSSGNRFSGNTYILDPENGEFFRWINTFHTLAEWKTFWPDEG